MPIFITLPMLQFLTIGFTAFSAFYFIREVMVASPETFAELSKTKLDYNPNLVKTFSRQKADAKSGFSFLILSILFQSINLMFPVRFIDLNGLTLGAIIFLGIILVIIFSCSLKINKIYAMKTEKKILKALETRK